MTDDEHRRYGDAYAAARKQAKDWLGERATEEQIHEFARRSGRTAQVRRHVV